MHASACMYMRVNSSLYNTGRWAERLVTGMAVTLNTKMRMTMSMHHACVVCVYIYKHV